MTPDDQQLPDGNRPPEGHPPPAPAAPSTPPTRPLPEPGTAPLPHQGTTVDAPDPDPSAMAPDTVETSTEPMRLSYYAVSDVGRVRKDNQDSGYAGPWLLAVCDGVGGAARGDIASSTAVSELRQLDEAPGSVDLLTRVTDGLHEAHDSIAAQVDQDPALSGTSTTATVALFDGLRIAIGHIGDSRGYLFRDGELNQITTDHTFVQSLIDEGRITEEEARVHPHRNLILKALDGVHEVDPDLFSIAVAPGDRIFLCSDGACGVLSDSRMADILSSGSPEFAAIELVRASLDAGSSDNVTCVVADVVADVGAGQPDVDPDADKPEPMVVGAAAELKRRAPRGLFRGHRSGDTGELEPVDAEIPAGVGHAIQADPPVDPEAYRYAPLAPRRFTWLRRLMAAAVLLGLAWVATASAYWWTQQQYYVGEQDGRVAVFRGIEGLPGLSTIYRTSDLAVDDLPEGARAQVEEGIDADSFEDAKDTVLRIAEDAAPPDETE